MAANASAMESVSYRVASGDCLTKIAQKFYGQASLFVRIAESNRIQAPRYTIYAGATIVIPALNQSPLRPSVTTSISSIRLENAPAVSAVSQISSLLDSIAAAHTRAYSSVSDDSETSVWMKVTAYCNCPICTGKRIHDGLTALGDNAFDFKGVAADFHLLPKRARLAIPGVGIKEVDDTGKAMRDDAKQGIYHIDVRMPTHQQALSFGVKWLKVIISPPQRR